MNKSGRAKVRKVASGLGKAIKAHTAQRKLLKSALMSKIQMKTLKIQSASSTPQYKMPKTQLERLSILISLMQERFRYSQSWSRELKLQENLSRHDWLKRLN